MKLHKLKNIKSMEILKNLEPVDQKGEDVFNLIKHLDRNFKKPVQITGSVYLKSKNLLTREIDDLDLLVEPKNSEKLGKFIKGYFKAKKIKCRHKLYADYEKSNGDTVSEYITADLKIHVISNSSFLKNGYDLLDDLIKEKKKYVKYLLDNPSKNLNRIQKHVCDLAIIYTRKDT